MTQVQRWLWWALVGLAVVLAVTGIHRDGGTDFKGMFDAAFSDQVKFVLVDGREISTETIRTWFVVHAAVLPVAFAVCLAVVRRRSSSVDARTGA